MAKDTGKLDNSRVSKVLGKIVDYPDTYDASILVREPRQENRKHLGIEEGKELPFTGYDVWNAYEVSSMTPQGVPFTRKFKIAYPATNKYIVESKSIKLYLNSFNMDRNILLETAQRIVKTTSEVLSPHGVAIQQALNGSTEYAEISAKAHFEDLNTMGGISANLMAYKVIEDLSELLECEVSINIIDSQWNSGFDYSANFEANYTTIDNSLNIAKPTANVVGEHLVAIGHRNVIDQFELVSNDKLNYQEDGGFERFKADMDKAIRSKDSTFLTGFDSNINKYHSALLKSNCRVTSQPDWGDIYITCSEEVPADALLRYLISFRDECHFHEEICETVFERLREVLNPKVLVVECLYARRGGIDINPVRALSSDQISAHSILHKITTDPSLQCLKTVKQ